MKKTLKQIATEELSLSQLMTGRDKIDTEEIIDTYEDGITLDQIDICEIEGEEVAVYTFKEDDSVFAFGGLILKNLFKSWITEYGSVDRVNEILKDEPLSIKLERSKTKDGKRDVTKVSVIL